MPTPGEPLRVLVVGAGLGTNAGLGLEAMGKLGRRMPCPVL